MAILPAVDARQHYQENNRHSNRNNDDELGVKLDADTCADIAFLQLHNVVFAGNVNIVVDAKPAAVALSKLFFGGNPPSYASSKARIPTAVATAIESARKLTAIIVR